MSAPFTRCAESKASASRIGELTKRKKVAAEKIAEAVKQASREICYLRFIDGDD